MTLLNNKGNKQTPLQKVSSRFSWRKLQLLGAIQTLEKLAVEIAPDFEQKQILNTLTQLTNSLNSFNTQRFFVDKDKILSERTEHLKRKVTQIETR